MKEDSPKAEWKEVGKVDEYENSMKMPKLEANKTYKFQVAAVNSVGVGAFIETPAVTVTKAISEFKLSTHMIINMKILQICEFQ